ncbi:thymidylate synthase [Escherichia coli]|uniref:thymidylate synthase n=1 Tax=Escherichia coli TaxID=562 RepID=UPI00201B2DBF|nr:thymidylate synthase [Escherichia coli]
MTLLVTAECVDDLINDVHQAILADGLSNDPTKGSTLEILGAYLVLTDPRRRISRTESRGKLISCLGEFLWYLSAQNDLEFIKHFIPRYAESAESDGKIHGGYGPRLFNMRGLYNQLKNVINLLQEKKPTRRAVIQLFDASDLVLMNPLMIFTKIIRGFIRTKQANSTMTTVCTAMIINTGPAMLAN